MGDLLNLGKTDATSGEVVEQKEMYPVELYTRPVFDARASELSDVGLDAAQREALHGDAIAAVREANPEAPWTLEPLLEAFLDATIAGRRGADEPDISALDEHTRRELRDRYAAQAEDLRTAAYVNALNEQTRRELRDEYGAQAEDLLARTAAYVKERPKTAALLATRGLGSQPKIVRLLVERVRVTNYRGSAKTTLTGA